MSYKDFENSSSSCFTGKNIETKYYPDLLIKNSLFRILFWKNAIFCHFLCDCHGDNNACTSYPF